MSINENDGVEIIVFVTFNSLYVFNVLKDMDLTKTSVKNALFKIVPYVNSSHKNNV